MIRSVLSRIKHKDTRTLRIKAEHVRVCRVMRTLMRHVDTGRVEQEVESRFMKAAVVIKARQAIKCAPFVKPGVFSVDSGGPAT
jgi:hypothetical protein